MAMTEVECWTLILRGLTAIGTLFVAIMAIWGEGLRSLLAPPKLTISIHHLEGEIGEIIDGGKVKKIRTYHLKVTNQRRKLADAKNVRVMVYNITRHTPSKSDEYGATSSPIQLAWQFPQIHLMYPTIGTENICDLGYVVESEKFRLSTYVTPLGFIGELDKDQSMDLMIVAKADNAESNSLSVKIEWDGIWDNDAERMKNHLRIK